MIPITFPPLARLGRCVLVTTITTWDNACVKAVSMRCAARIRGGQCAKSGGNESREEGVKVERMVAFGVSAIIVHSSQSRMCARKDACGAMAVSMGWAACIPCAATRWKSACNEGCLAARMAAVECVLNAVECGARDEARQRQGDKLNKETNKQEQQLPPDLELRVPS